MTNVNKNFYIAVQKRENGKYCAYAVKVSTADNLLYRLDRTGVIAANICATKKEAAELVRFWNDCFRKNGTSLFGEARA